MIFPTALHIVSLAGLVLQTPKDMLSAVESGLEPYCVFGKDKSSSEDFATSREQLGN